MSLKQTLLLPIALMAACAPADGTRPLTRDEHTQVAEAIDNERENLKAVIPMLGYTDGLFNLHGRSVENSSALVPDLEKNLAQLQSFFDEDRIVVGSDNFFQQVAEDSPDTGLDGEEIAGVAFGRRCISFDNYVVLPEEPTETTDSGWILSNIDAGTLSHEAAHFTYGPHDLAVELASESDRPSVVSKEHDAPYLTDYLSGFAGKMEGSLSFLDESVFTHDFEIYVSWVDSGAKTPQEVYDYLSGRKKEAAKFVEDQLNDIYTSDLEGVVFLRNFGGLEREEFDAYFSDKKEGYVEIYESNLQALIDRFVAEYPGQIVVE